MNETSNHVEEKTPELFIELAKENKLQLLEGNFGYEYGIKSFEDTNLRILVNAMLDRVSSENWGVLKEDFYDLVITGKGRIEETYKYLISPLSKNDKNHWIYGIPFLIHSAYKNGNKEKLTELLKITKGCNKWAMSHAREMPDKNGYYSDRKQHSREELQKIRNREGKFQYLGKYGVIPILRMTVELALDKGDIDFAKELLEINDVLREEPRHECRSEDITTAQSPWYLYSYTPYEFKCEVLKRDTKMSEIDKHIELAVHDDILNLDELIYTKITEQQDQFYHKLGVFKNRGPVVKDNLPKIYATIKKYPICDIEYWLNLVNKGKWDELKKSINSSNKKLPSGYIDKLNQTIDSKDTKAFKELLTRIYDSSHSGYSKKEDIVYQVDKDNDYFPKRRDEEKLDSLFERIKKSLIESIEIEEKTYSRVNSFDKKYFDRLLEKKNYRDLLIDLCVRLETILEGIHKYGNEDTSLSDIVDKATSDNPNLIPLNMRELLHKLIRCRNNEVHRRVGSEMMTGEELQKCIDFICGME